MKPCEAFLVLDQDVRAISYIVILYTIKEVEVGHITRRKVFN